MGKSSSTPSGQQTVTQVSEPWTQAQPFLKNVMNRAESLYGNNQLSQGFFPYSTVVPFSPESQMAMNMTTNRALMGNPLSDAARNQALSTIQGSYLNANPYLNATADVAANKAQNAVQSMFAKSGRYGSPAMARSAAEGVANAVLPYYGQAYESERDRQLRTMGAAPSLAATDYADIAALQGVGQQKEARAQQYINDALTRFGAPSDQLSRYAGLVSGMGQMGSSQTSQQPIYGQSPVAGALGGAMLGQGLTSLPFFTGEGAGAALAGELGGFALPVIGGLLGGLFS